MSHEQAQRLSERWFRFALWIIAVVFAGFLIGLGGTLVKNLPLVEQSLQSEDFIDRPAAEQTRQEIERQRQAEAKPDAERRQELPYDTALARLAKRVCPGCERAVELDNPQIDYCPHCGICLFDHCG